MCPPPQDSTAQKPEATVPVPPQPKERVDWPNVHARPEQRTFQARFHRNALLFVLYFLWIFGLAGYSLMWLYTFTVLARALITGNVQAIPVFVQFYLVANALYYSYHALVLGNHRQGLWRSLRTYCRRTFAKYPYFRHNICIFEEHEAECLQDPHKPLVKAKDKAMFAFHPHGVLTCGFSLNGVHSMRFAESDARWLVAENLFWFPLLRDILNWLEFGDVSKKTFLRHMREERNVCLIPGGFEEATIFARGKHRVYLKKRFGFIKLALQHGYKVHPVYTFGEEETYFTFPYFLKQRLGLNQHKIPGVVFFGRLACFFLPRSNFPLTTVVGKPIQLPKIETPTTEDVAKYHKIYVDQLIGLFERNKHKYAIRPNVELELY